MWSKVPVPTPRESRGPCQHHDLQMRYTESSVICGVKFQYLLPGIAVSLANTTIYRWVIQTVPSYMEKSSSTSSPVLRCPWPTPWFTGVLYRHLCRIWRKVPVLALANIMIYMCVIWTVPLYCISSKVPVPPSWDSCFLANTMIYRFVIHTFP